MSEEFDDEYDEFFEVETDFVGYAVVLGFDDCYYELHPLKAIFMAQA